MPNITIDGKDYDLDNLPKEAKDHLASLQFVEAEIQRLHALTAVALTARTAYFRALGEILKAAPPQEEERF